MRNSEAVLHGGLQLSGYFVWGGSVVYGEDGRYHMFASRWPAVLGGSAWVTSSEVVHASASRPEGPFDFHGPALPRRGSEFWDGMSTHNPTVVWDAHARLYRLFYTGMRYAFAPPADGPFLNRTEYETAWNSKRVGVASASSVYGPWRREATPLLMPRPGHWDAAITSNPAAVIFSSGRTVLFYKSIASPYPQRCGAGIMSASVLSWRRP
eukprot:2189766-Pleurochrysis_carterae.AAC.1